MTVTQTKGPGGSSATASRRRSRPGIAHLCKCAMAGRSVLRSADRGNWAPRVPGVRTNHVSSSHLSLAAAAAFAALSGQLGGAAFLPPQRNKNSQPTTPRQHEQRPRPALPLQRRATAAPSQGLHTCASVRWLAARCSAALTGETGRRESPGFERITYQVPTCHSQPQLRSLPCLASWEGRHSCRPNATKTLSQQPRDSKSNAHARRFFCSGEPPLLPPP